MSIDEIIALVNAAQEYADETTRTLGASASDTENAQPSVVWSKVTAEHCQTALST